MNIRHSIFLAVNILGGILVIGSYILSIRAHGSAEPFWGGVPVSMRSLYGVSMLIAAVSYTTMTLFILLRVAPDSAKICNMCDFRLFIVLYSLILAASALWMPLTYALLGNPSVAVEFLVKAVLVIVALGALGVLVSLLGLSPKPSGVFYWASVAGALLFFLHTAVLDATLWSYYWGK